MAVRGKVAGALVVRAARAVAGAAVRAVGRDGGHRGEEDEEGGARGHGAEAGTGWYWTLELDRRDGLCRCG